MVRFKLLIILFYLIYFLLIFSVAQAVEIELKYLESSVEVYLKDVPEVGVGSFFVEIIIYERENIKGVHSENFMIVTNLEGSRLLVAGIQGQVPGPSGNVLLFKVEFSQKSKIEISKAIVSDVNGKTLIKVTKDELKKQESEFVKTSENLRTKTNSQETYFEEISEISDKAISEEELKRDVSVAPTSTTPMDQLITDTSPSTSNLKHEILNESKKVENVSRTSETQKAEIKWIPGFETSLAIAVIMLILAVRLWRRDKR